MVSTVASGNTRAYVGGSDICMMYSVVDIAGLNRFTQRVLSNAAAAIAGMAENYVDAEIAPSPKPAIAATQFGVTTPCVTMAREHLEALGYEVIVFHATGIGGGSMESLIASGEFSGVLDVTTTELASELVGATMSAGLHRLEAAGALGASSRVSRGSTLQFSPLRRRFQINSCAISIHQVRL